MTQREFQLAKRAAASIMAAAMLAAAQEREKPKPKKARKKRENTGVAKALQEKLFAANAAYESRKEAGATLAGIEKEFDLKSKSLNNWRSRRMIHGSAPIKRTYTNRPLKKHDL